MLNHLHRPINVLPAAVRYRLHGKKKTPIDAYLMGLTKESKVATDRQATAINAARCRMPGHSSYRSVVICMHVVCSDKVKERNDVNLAQISRTALGFTTTLPPPQI